ncbi:MAG TPA: sulfurtransferase TusA family protein [Gammaproteobacteria bacterium]|nr:sulfurtransferase TusA family protein [Gammaproteobacteria bacterium]
MSDAKVVDARGSFCPGPLMELIAAMKEIEVGDEVEVLSTDEGSANDVPEWLDKVGHELVSNSQEDGVFHIRARKAK